MTGTLVIKHVCVFILLMFSAGRCLALDTDQDGIPDGQDPWPNDPASVFRINGAMPIPAAGEFRITWPTATGVFSRVWQSGDLTNWVVARDWGASLTPPEETAQLDLTPSNTYFWVEADITL